MSTSASRNAPQPLSGAALTGDVYVFLATDPAIQQVEFWLDDTGLTSSPRQVEREGPYDFAGGSASVARPFDTTALSDGPHVISTRVTYTDGHVEATEAHFTTGGAQEPPPPDEEEPSPPEEEPVGEVVRI
ncbi:hypothetical protein PU560_00820, partial [Georgenia sp. 10Sc9-8]|nr:hypothetical protein [Georgenia halotolerans]